MDAFECNGDAYADDPEEREPAVYGPRWTVLLATREPNDFHMLQPPSLPRTRGTVNQDSSLNELLMEQTYFKTRGDSRRRRPRKLFDESWSAATVQWIVVPNEQ